MPEVDSLGPSNVTNSSKSTCPSPVGHGGSCHTLPRHGDVRDTLPIPPKSPHGAAWWGGTPLPGLGDAQGTHPSAAQGGPAPNLSVFWGDPPPPGLGTAWGHPTAGSPGGTLFLGSTQSAPPPHATQESLVSTRAGPEQQPALRDLGLLDFTRQGPPNSLGTPNTSQDPVAGQGPPKSVGNPGTSWGPAAKLGGPPTLARMPNSGWGPQWQPGPQCRLRTPPSAIWRRPMLPGDP